jgi:hypothetical protein
MGFLYFYKLSPPNFATKEPHQGELDAQCNCYLTQWINVLSIPFIFFVLMWKVHNC